MPDRDHGSPEAQGREESDELVDLIEIVLGRDVIAACWGSDSGSWVSVQILAKHEL